MTAVEWLTEKLRTEFGFAFSNNILEEANEIEKKHIIDACYFAYNEGCAYMSGSTTKYESFEQYYEETFNK
jgi:hypothetical protein